MLVTLRYESMAHMRAVASLSLAALPSTKFIFFFFFLGYDIGNHVMPEHYVIHSPDELCWVHIILSTE